MGTQEPTKLSELLRQWPDLEPRPDFGQDVLRRIRLEAARPPAKALWTWLPARLGSPWGLAWAAGIPLLLALLAGIASARVLPAAHHRSLGPYSVSSVLERGTVAGNYVAMTEAR